MIDGSVDRTNIDKICILAKIINEKGKLETIFLVVGEQTTRGADGLLETIERTIKRHDPDLYDIILKKMSSFVTDGAFINTGHRSGLWTRIEKKAKESGSLLKLLKVWCAAHRNELAWKSVTSSVKEVSGIFRNLVSISSFFQSSGLRTSVLKAVAKERDLELMHLPKLFEVRWTEFTFDLLNSILMSWNALTLFYKMTTEKNVPKFFYTFLTNHKKLELIAFLADLLNVYQRHQKRLQADDLTIISMDKVLNDLRSEIQELKTKPLLDG